MWGGFGGLGFYLGLEFDIGLFVFCFRGFFELFSVVRNVLKPWFYMVVMSSWRIWMSEVEKCFILGPEVIANTY